MYLYVERIRYFLGDALYKFTFYLLTYLLNVFISVKGSTIALKISQRHGLSPAIWDYSLICDTTKELINIQRYYY